MKNNKIQDERIVSQRRKIGSDAFGILYIGLLISILVQQFIYDAPFSQYAAEFILFMVVAIYVVVRNIMVGTGLYNSSSNSQKLVVINSIVCGLAITTVTTTVNTMKLGLEKMGGTNGILITALITFLSGTLIAFAGFEILYTIDKKRQKQLDDKYNDIDE